MIANLYSLLLLFDFEVFLNTMHLIKTNDYVRNSRPSFPFTSHTLENSQFSRGLAFYSFEFCIKCGAQ